MDPRWVEPQARPASPTTRPGRRPRPRVKCMTVPGCGRTPTRTVTRSAKSRAAPRAAAASLPARTARSTTRSSRRSPATTARGCARTRTTAGRPGRILADVDRVGGPPRVRESAGSGRRRGCDSPRGRGAAAGATRIVRGDCGAAAGANSPRGRGVPPRARRGSSAEIAANSPRGRGVLPRVRRK